MIDKFYWVCGMMLNGIVEIGEVDEGVSSSNVEKNPEFTMTGEIEQHYSGNIMYSLFWIGYFTHLQNFHLINAVCIIDVFPGKRKKDL